MSVVRSIRILAEFTFPSSTLRLWDGSAPYMDASGNIWAGVGLLEGLDEIETALNGEAATLELFLSGVDPETADLAYEDYDNDEVIGATVRLLIQDCDEYDQPVGAPQVRFTGTIDDLILSDSASETGVTSTITAEVTNRFVMGSLRSGAVLSDVDQKARSSVINPGADADRFCERVPIYFDKTINWPEYT